MWAGGRGPKRTPAIAAKYCSGWNVPYVGPDEYARLNQQINAACEAIDRDPATLERSVNLAFHMGATRAAADRELQRIIDQWGPEMAERVTQGALTGTPKMHSSRLRDTAMQAQTWSILRSDCRWTTMLSSPISSR